MSIDKEKSRKIPIRQMADRALHNTNFFFKSVGVSKGILGPSDDTDKEKK